MLFYAIILDVDLSRKIRRVRLVPHDNLEYRFIAQNKTARVVSRDNLESRSIAQNNTSSCCLAR